MFFLEAKIALKDLPSSGRVLKCVNVGKRSVKAPIINDINKRDAHMRSQCVDVTVWIPACLLEIVPHQRLKVQLSPKQISSMIGHAVHLPARNVDLITKEGLNILSIKEQNVALVR